MEKDDWSSALRGAGSDLRDAAVTGARATAAANPIVRFARSLADTFRPIRDLLAAILKPKVEHLGTSNRAMGIIGHVTNILALAVTVVLSVVLDWSDLVGSAVAIVAWWWDTFVGLAIIAGVIIVVSIAFVAAAYPGQRREMLRGVWHPLRSVLSYYLLLVVIYGALWGSGVFMSWSIDRWNEGAVDPLTVILSIVAIIAYLLAWWVAIGTFLIGTYYASYYMFAAADAHPMFAGVVVIALSAVSVGQVVAATIAGAEFGAPAVTLLLVGPGVTLVLATVELVWLARSRGVRPREAWVPVAADVDIDPIEQPDRGGPSGREPSENSPTPVEQARDPATDAPTLRDLAMNHPGLRPHIAANPSTYPALLDWLGALGDPEVDAALAAR